MPRIFDNAVQYPRAGHPVPPAPPRSERRRSARSNAHVPVFIYGHDSDQAPFHEAAYSVMVSETGGMLVMTEPVTMGDTLLLTNQVTEAQQECRVVRIARHEEPSIEVAVEFCSPVLHFWRLRTPPRQTASLAPPLFRRDAV